MVIINKSHEIKGSLFIFFSAFMYATLPILGKLAFQTGLTPSAILLLRYLFSLLLLSVYIKLIKNKKVLTLSPLVITQGIFFTLGSLFYFYSLKYLAAGIASVIFFTYPVIVACLAVPIYKEKLAPRLICALSLALGGIFLISGIGREIGGISLTGVILVLCGCVCYAFFGLIGQKTVANADPISITATLSLVALIIIAFFSNHDLVFLYHLSWKQVLIGLTMAVANTLLAVLFFLKGVQEIGASRATLISTAEPPLSILLAFIVLGETLTLWQLFGSVLVFGGMILAISPSKAKTVST